MWETRNLSLEVARSWHFKAGRPPGLPAGSDIRSVIAVNAEAQFPRPGAYEFRAELGGKVRSTTFRVKSPLSLPPGMQPPLAS